MSVSESETKAVDEDDNFENPSIGNRVSKTRFPAGTHVEIESKRLDFHVNATCKLCHIRRGQAYKPSLKDSIFKPKIESLRLEML